MTVQDVEKWLESEWAALVSRVHEMFHKTNVEAVPADKGQDIAPPSAPVEVAPSVAPIPATTPSGAPNNAVLDGYMHSNPQYHDTSGGEDKPRVDTSAATLDFAVVGNGVPIDLNGPKTIINCPASVVVQINLASGQSGATNSYDVTVNGVTANQPNSQAQYTTSAQGPTVNVSVSCPGLQMEIRG